MKVGDIVLLDLYTKRGVCGIDEKYHQCPVKIQETNRKGRFVYPISIRIIENNELYGVYPEMLKDAVEFKLREFLEIL